MKRWPGRLKWLVAYLFAVWAFRSTVIDLNYVSGRSMLPTLRPGDIVLVNKLAYGLSIPFTSCRLVQWGQPRPGEVVILTRSVKGDRLVKRVAGLPGDAVGPGQVVPTGGCYVLGDNRAQSSDSRSFGSVPQSGLVGRVVGVTVSFDPDHYCSPRWGRFRLSVDDPGD